MTALALAPIAAYLDDRREDVAEDLRRLAADLCHVPSAAMLPGAIAWLTGRHEGWGDPSLWPELPAWMRDRMKRAAGDLALGWPTAARHAGLVLAEAASLIWIEEEETP